MKKPVTHLRNPISTIRSKRKLTRLLSVFLSVLLLHLFTGCSYYRVKGLPDSQQDTRITWIKKFNEAQKYIIVHQGGTELHLSNAYLEDARLLLSGTLDTISPRHSYKHTVEIGKGYRYKRKIQSPLNEVHIFVGPEVRLTPKAQVDIPISSIQKIGYSDTNAGRSVINVAGTVLGAFALLLIIVALTKSSCPFVYADNGAEFVFQGELYPGNIIENAQKTDYLRMPSLKDVNGTYTVSITNELQEVQHTDEVILEVVDHPAGVTVLMDPNGNVYSISKPLAPYRALADGKYDQTQAISHIDEAYAAFNSPEKNSEGTRNLDLWFDHQADQSRGKLVLRLKNTFWLDFAMQKFFQQMGSYYSTFQQEQQKSTQEKIYRWRADQDMPLSVYVDSGQGWALQHQVNAVGPMMYRDLVVPLDLAEVGDGPVKVRLKTGHQFWEIDRVAIDYTWDMELPKKALTPAEAIDNYGMDVSGKMERADKEYYIQKEIGDRVDIQFRSPPMQDESRTVFLRNKGYYIYKRSYNGEPDFDKLKQFRKPGHFTRFAQEQYNALFEALLSQNPEIVAQDETH